MKKRDKDRPEQSPLLYISQPPLTKPSASMQQSFIIKNRKSESTVVERQTDKLEPTLLENEVTQQEEESSSTEEIEAVIPSAAAEAVLEAADIEEAVLEISSAEKQETVLETSSVEEQEVKQAPFIRKAFRDMNIEEKLSYLLNRPHYIPQVLCEVEAKTGMYTGYIVSFDNGVVILRTHTQFFMTKIPYEDIIDIQMRAL